MAIIAPALIAADFTRLGEALDFIRAAGATVIHLDVTDGHFVPDITVGQPVIASLRKATDLELDVHLLIERPERFVREFADLGVQRLSVHPESTVQLHRVLDLIRARGAKAGVALNPATSFDSVGDVLDGLDFLTILAADPGVDEGPFIPQSVAKVRAARRLRAERRLSFALQIEGAVGFENLGEFIRAGADILVAGSAIFDSQDPAARLAEMISLASVMSETSRV